MKKIILIVLAAIFAACSSEDTLTVNEPEVVLPEHNKVLVLKVDLLTNTFEGGKELEFDDSDSFTITADYNSPGDFGDITLSYAETGRPLFAGGVVWMGLGEMTFPMLDLPTAFATHTTALPQPASSDFEYAYEYTGDYLFSEYYESINYQALWQSISGLELVQQYRAANPDAKIKLFLYTPGIGVGDPTYWKWIIFIKN